MFCMKPAVNRLHHHTVIPLALDTAGQLVHPMAQLQAFLIELLHTHMSIIKTQGGYYESGGVWSPFQTAYSINPYQYNERGQSYGPIDGFLSTG